MAEVRLKVVLDGAEQTINTVSQLEDALQRTKSELAGLEIGSTGFKALQNQARQLDSELKNIQKATEGVDTAKLAGSFAKLGESVVGAFAISTSALKLFGQESEDVAKAQEQAQQTLNIVLGARAIAEGVVEGAAAARLIVDKVSVITTNALTLAFGRQTVALAAEAAAAGTATAAQTALNTAMKLSPIGLLIGGLTALIVYWDDLSQALGLSQTELEKFNTDQKKVSDDLDKELNESLAQTIIKYNELQNALQNTEGAAQQSWLQTALKDLPELINLTGKEADAVQKVTEALQLRETIAINEEKRNRNLKELAQLEVEILKPLDANNKAQLAQNEAVRQRINAIREANVALDNLIGKDKAALDQQIKGEADKKKATEDAKKASEEAFKRRLEQIKQERQEIQELLKSTRDETKKQLKDIEFDERASINSRIEGQFTRAREEAKLAKDRRDFEIQQQREAAFASINQERLTAQERARINAEFDQRLLASKETLNREVAAIDQKASEQRVLADNALKNELDFGDSVFNDRLRARSIETQQFINDLEQRRLTETTRVDTLTIKEKVNYFNNLAKLQNESLELELMAAKENNEANFQEQLQLNQDKLDREEITQEQFDLIQQRARIVKAEEDIKAEEAIAQKKKQINFQTEQEILNAKIQGIQQYLAFATTGIQALAQISTTVEQNQLARVTETNNAELTANQEKNQSILNQELARIDAETTTETEKQAKRDAAIKKSQDKKAADDKKTEEKIEKQRNEIRKKAFARTKALNISTALINGAQSVLQAIAQFGPPPSPLGIAGIAAAGVLTAAQVAAIASQQYQEEGGSPSRELSVPEVGGVSEAASPGTPSGGFTLFNPDLVNVTQTGGRGRQGGGGTMGPLKVIVVESDITNAQNSVRTTVDQASFG